MATDDTETHENAHGGAPFRPLGKDYANPIAQAEMAIVRTLKGSLPPDVACFCATQEDSIAVLLSNAQQNLHPFVTVTMIELTDVEHAQLGLVPPASLNFRTIATASFQIVVSVPTILGDSYPLATSDLAMKILTTLEGALFSLPLKTSLAFSGWEHRNGSNLFEVLLNFEAQILLVNTVAE